MMTTPRQSGRKSRRGTARRTVGSAGPAAERPLATKTQRIRDPIHDLIVFDEEDALDRVAWELLNCPEFQRLRRIKQLGVSEFVFPGATHTRFAHSIGVFHNARRLLKLIERELRLGRAPGTFDSERARVAVLAALLHDIGHGPFSHAFEEARKTISRRRGQDKIKKHEGWTADIIANGNGRLAEILERRPGTATQVANLVRAETPGDMYHAIVSSSFDADRLDYLQRDRYMTGTASGAIDLTWLLDNVRVAHIDVSPAGETDADPIYTHNFCLYHKAREAAEDFLLARYRLYSTVYLNKTTRGIEQMLSAVFRGIAETIETGDPASLGLGDDHPLVRFFSPGGEGLSDYLALDDTVVWGAIERLERCANSRLASVARRLRTRENPPVIDISTLFPDDSERQRRAKHRLESQCGSELDITVFKDEARLTLYGEIGADDAKAQMRLMIQLANGQIKEITELKDATIVGSNRERRFLRYYFLDESEHKRVLDDIKRAM